MNRHQTAADALVASFPASGTLTATPVTDTTTVPVTSQAVLASYVGAPSAELGLIVSDERALTVGADSAAGISLADVLHPALNAAAGALGGGVLSAAATGDGTTLFGDDTSDVYALADAAGMALAYFAVRTRLNGGGDPLPLTEFAGNLSRISSVEMSLTVEIGRTRMSVRDVLSLEPGNIVELDRSAGAPADILLNGRKIALGEIVVVDQDYAVKVTQILDATDELQ
ncbi:flagellar motor switch protein FliN [Curtobacterium sp. MCBD17_040]|uniref:flagellar motor switch protein FliN n=1 Tax=Curtobacterium sp. MCBD17_040 TaxID=2175674 RepID=UPI000DAAB9D8|nr:flagellar motor switch protein FliN [Curtobacterium sp. MCBD17_040]WIB65966.1 flagellar motor switch protein FliN [Curtobacterium sp. MCBD17_040]